MEEGDREPFGPVLASRRVDHAMEGRDPAVVGPARHHVADIDHERTGRRTDVDPLAIGGEGLQPARPVLAIEDRQRSVVGMGAGAQLAGLRRFRLGHVFVEADMTDRARDLVVEETLVDFERDSEDPHQLVADAAERPVIGLESRPNPGRAFRPQIGRKEIPAVTLGVVGLVRQVEIAHAEHLLQVGRGVVAERGRQFLVCRRIVAPGRGNARPRNPHLLFQGQGEEFVGEVARLADHAFRNAVAHDGEEADGFQRVPDLLRDPAFPRRVSRQHRRDVDLGNAVRCHRKPLPPCCPDRTMSADIRARVSAAQAGRRSPISLHSGCRTPEAHRSP